MADRATSEYRWRLGRSTGRVAGRVCSALFFFPRGGSAQVTRALSQALAGTGWQVRLAAGSLGGPGAPTNARSFYSGSDVSAVDYSPALRFADPLAAPVPFQPSYEDRPTGPDRVFAAVDDAAYERLVAAWAEALARAGAAEADLLHLHHLTPAHEAARRAFPSLPIVGQLHGTELAFLRVLAAGLPRGWRYARAWERRLRRWAHACERLIVPPGAEVEVAAPFGLERFRLRGLPSGVELDRFRPRPLAGEARRAFWQRWLVECPQGWDEHGQPGSVAYRDEELSSFASGTILVYLGRFTAVKRLPLLIRAHARAQARLERPAPLVLVGGHPGEWEGEHPLKMIRQVGAREVFLAGWRPHEQLPQALNAADVPAVGRGGVRARARGGDGLRPTRDRLQHARAGGDRPGRGERLARAPRRRAGTGGSADRGRLAGARATTAAAAIATRVACLYQEVVAQRQKGGAEAELRRDRSGG